MDLISSWNLQQHGLIEASAGTGKTYTIEQILLRLLTQYDPPDLSQILILTFTDKAAGELREKIERRLHEASKDENRSAKDRQHFKACLLRYDQASIFTLHSFCKKILKQFAFENQALFSFELVDDKTLYQQLLAEEMRKQPLARARILNEDSHWEPLLEIAQKYNPQVGDLLWPEPDFELCERLNTEVQEILKSLGNIFGDVNEAKEHAFYLSYKKIKTDINAKATFLKYIALILSDFSKWKTNDFDISSQKEFLIHVDDLASVKTLKDNGWDIFYLNSPDAKNSQALQEFVSLVKTAQTLLDPIAEAEKAMTFIPQIEAIKSIQQRIKVYKEEKGLLSFDDLIRNVHKTINSRPELVDLLRIQYKYCMVDEFQDTDGLQWGILKTLFLEENNTHPLYLIGDPKQAIYAFRGGDIETYFSARHSLYALAQKGFAQAQGLGTSYRSSPELLQAFNGLFSHPLWFEPLLKAQTLDESSENENVTLKKSIPLTVTWKLPLFEKGLSYTPVDCGGTFTQSGFKTKDDLPPIIIKDFSSLTKLSEVKRSSRQWIVNEIKLLLQAPENFAIPLDTEKNTRPLLAGDICILVRDASDRRGLEILLREAGIPYAAYKKSGLYQGVEALQFSILLAALEKPSDIALWTKALLSAFCDLPPENVAGLKEISPDHILQKTFSRWRELAEARLWPEFFNSVLNDSGLVYRLSLAPDRDRRLMNFKHLAQELEVDALRLHLDLSRLYKHLQQKRLQTNSSQSEEKDLERIASEKQKIRIMTMHISKGLEFPIVFIAGGYGKGGKALAPKYLSFHSGENKVYALDKKHVSWKELHDEELDNEDKRLFYVACTRAKYRLYIPTIGQEYTRVKIGPLGTFLREALINAKAKYPQLFYQRDEELLLAKNTLPAISSLSSLTNVTTDFTISPPPKDLLPKHFYPFALRRLRVESYSHLAFKHQSQASSELEGERLQKDDLPPWENTFTSDIEEVLPRGADTGNLLHDILEGVDFQITESVKTWSEFILVLENTSFLRLVRAKMREYVLPSKYETSLLRLLWNTLKCPIPKLHNHSNPSTFSLCSIQERIHEMEFLFPFQGADSEMRGEIIPDTFPQKGFLWGYIDLVFRIEGVYYLADWKSNTLENYLPESLKHSVVSSKYDLQIMLYSLALHKWLKSTLADYNFEKHFGGVYYFYLRGMQEENSMGIFTHRPNLEQLEKTYPAYLHELLSLGKNKNTVSIL